VSHKRCKNKALTIEKLNAVSVKRILNETFQEKFKAIMSFKFAKKFEKNLSPPPLLPTKKVLRFRIRKKHAESKLRFLSTSGSQVGFASSLSLLCYALVMRWRDCTKIRVNCALHKHVRL